ncbi:antibiotic biosynthesis monooxygenase [Pseudomonas sp. LS-2]|jgi:antibiotic biosynthesis monooxygenase (ABM) superfamily enzyme|uniref:antibiotic biosynthesis monooxygenase n=1 Tax=Pseudomonas sp. LS-2 TaxID=2315859 RepID=UPI000E710EBF|nr:antibiotic biosynthesis monooxygenase [Pseudomonas sp. LS-2]RJX78760.1 antibiotic biosynthesis monooxygenase [Pseudomonas sp. LS-2]
MPDSALSVETFPTAKLSPDEIVTLVVKHRAKLGMEAQYEAWLRRVVAIAGTYPGHLGVDVIRGKSDGLHMFTCVLRFCSTDAMQSWLNSAERRELVAEASPMLADGDFTEVNPHNEFWFVPASENPPPPRWKQACVTFLVICPLTLMIPLVWGPVFRMFPLLANYVISTALVTVTIVLLVVYLLMPLATRLFAPWLNARAQPVSQDLTDEG